ncbi:monovalent cation/H+ antiporter complex subunit F [Streptomyces sp. NPDC006992]|uniref:monovalent cation/H+ antiporter complex subunit F n=1 Tax=unclassified Streptomyces TaxID=2593676 RepID=UPI0033D159E0
MAVTVRQTPAALPAEPARVLTAAAHDAPAFEITAAVIAGLLLAAGLLVTLRLVRGPSTLDRAVALDVLVAVVMAGIGLQSAIRGNAFYLPVLLVLSFLGFTGSVGVARFMALRDEAGTEDVDESEGTGEPPADPSAPPPGGGLEEPGPHRGTP